MFENYYGQKHLIGENRPIYKMITNNSIQSMVLYGNPGVGKTKLANIICNNLNYKYCSLNAASSSLQQFKDVLKESTINDPIIIIVDEIHQLDKKKQNFLLEQMELNSIFIIGTTTDNPYISLSSAIRSRLLIFELHNISQNDLINGLKSTTNNIYSDEVYIQIYNSSAGDVRMSQNITKFLQDNYDTKEVDVELIKSCFKIHTNFNYSEDSYYDLLSALQKSIRGSDLDGALHYLARLIKVGDFDSLIRRLTVIGYEDVSLASPNSVYRSVMALNSFKHIGMPEGRILLANAVCELALAPKSPSAYMALDDAINDINNYEDEVPDFIKYNQPSGFKYDRNKVANIDTLPKRLKNKRYLKNFKASKSEDAFYERYKNRNELKKKHRSYNE